MAVPVYSLVRPCRWSDRHCCGQSRRTPIRKRVRWISSPPIKYNANTKCRCQNINNRPIWIYENTTSHCSRITSQTHLHRSGRTVQRRFRSVQKDNRTQVIQFSNLQTNHGEIQVFKINRIVLCFSIIVSSNRSVDLIKFSRYAAILWHISVRYLSVQSRLLGESFALVANVVGVRGIIWLAGNCAKHGAKQQQHHQHGRRRASCHRRGTAQPRWCHFLFERRGRVNNQNQD